MLTYQMPLVFLLAAKSSRGENRVTKAAFVRKPNFPAMFQVSYIGRYLADLLKVEEKNIK